jgi:hypothetical protein
LLSPDGRLLSPNGVLLLARVDLPSKGADLLNRPFASVGKPYASVVGQTNTSMRKQMDPAIQLKTRRDVANRWQKSIESIKRMEKAGLLRALTIGRSVRYKIEDIERVEAEAEVR